MDYTALIVAVLQIFAQYGPGLVKSVTDLIQGNPQQTNEADDAYIARIASQIDAKAADTAATDAQVEKS